MLIQNDRSRFISSLPQRILNQPFRFRDRPFAALLLALLIGALVVRTAWLNDDAYITFRVVDNFSQGYGLTWNPGERVQVYTHPLWLLLLLPLHALTGELFYTTLWLSIGLSTTAVFLLAWRVAGTMVTAVLAAFTFSLSKAFIDYATSGLENPLTYLLLVLFVAVCGADLPPARRLFWTTLLFGLALLARTDLLLLLGPLLALVWWETRAWRHWPAAALALLPPAAWLLFSLLYYGFPFPNTAYTKAFATGISPHALAAQGWRYLQNSWRWDPLTLAVIGTTAVWAIGTRRLRPLAGVLGIALYLTYVVRIGGDFMSGRFLAAPLLLAVLLPAQALPARALAARRVWLPLLLALFWLGWQANVPVWLSDSAYGTLPQHQAVWRDGHVADERIFYYPYTGLLRGERPLHPWREQALIARQEGERVVRRGNVGFFGYYVGPETHVVDHFALTDALLARLPAENPDEWRPGHVRRVVPPGYLETAAGGDNQIADPHLAAYYDHLRLVIRGPLWQRERLATIWRLNTGAYDGLLLGEGAAGN